MKDSLASLGASDGNIPEEPCNTGAIPSHIQGGEEYGLPCQNRGEGCGQIVPNDIRDEIVDTYRTFFEEIFRYCTYRLFKKDIAEDATSAVFVRMVHEYPVLRHKSRCEIRSWLYGTASNVVASYFRDVRRYKEILNELGRVKGISSPPRWVRDVQLDWPVVYKAICRLNPRQQAIVIMRFVKGFELSTIAEALGMRQVTVRVYLSRAIKKLKQELEKLFGGVYELA